MSFYRKPLKIHRYNYKFVRTMNTFFRYMKSSKYGKYLNHNKITLSRTRRRRRFLKLKFLNSVKLKKKLFKLYYFKNKIARNNFYYAILLKRKVYTKFFKGFRKRKNQKAFFKELNNFKYKLKKKYKKLRFLKKKKIIKKKLLTSIKLTSSNNIKFNNEFLKNKKKTFKSFFFFKILKVLKKKNKKKILLKQVINNKINSLTNTYNLLKKKFNKFKIIEFSVLRLKNLIVDNLEKIEIKNKIEKFEQYLNNINLLKLKLILIKLKKNIKFLILKKPIFLKRNIKYFNIKKIGFKSKPIFFKKNKRRFFKNKIFNFKKANFRRYSFFKTLNFRKSLLSKKFKRFLRTSKCKKYINFKKHYNKFIKFNRSKKKKKI